MFATLSRYNENDEAEYWGDVDRFKFRITITMEERLALKRQEEEDTLGGSSSGIVRAHIFFLALAKKNLLRNRKEFGGC